MLTHFKISSTQYNQLTSHLLQDGLETGAIALCNHVQRENQTLLLCQELIPIAIEESTHRSEGKLVWSVTKHLVPLSERIEKNDYSVFLFHNHPKGFEEFSDIDDQNDSTLIPCLYNWSNSPVHGTGILMPDGKIKLRTVSSETSFDSIEKVSFISDRIKLSYSTSGLHNPSIIESAQSFGAGTKEALHPMTIGVIGASGTGSIMIEQLYRSGAGELRIVDNDHVEEKNLNRIPNTKVSDAKQSLAKVDVLKKAYEEIGLGTQVIAMPTLANDPDTVKKLSMCDVIFCCVDNATGRHIANQISCAYLIPLFELGSHLELDSNNSVTHVFASANYIQPDKSSLLSRGVYTIEQFTAESYRSEHPELYKDEVKRGYLENVDTDQPMVMPVNMMAATYSMNDFLARIHGYRMDDDAEFASIKINIGCGYTLLKNEIGLCDYFKTLFAVGDRILKYGVLAQ